MSSTGAVSVRVLSGLPTQLWSDDLKYASRVARVQRNNPDDNLAAAVASDPIRVFDHRDHRIAGHGGHGHSGQGHGGHGHSGHGHGGH